MHHAPLVFCERTGRWAAAWRRLVDGARLVETSNDGAARTGHEGMSGRSASTVMSVIETRSLAECRDVVTQAPAAFFAIELAQPTLEAAFEFLFELLTSHSRAVAVVLIDRSVRPSSAGAALADSQVCEVLARELGAILAVRSVLEIPTLAGPVRRHIEHTPPPHRTTQQRIWETLPWGQEGRIHAQARQLP